ncbi:hypothetical protein NZK32_08270 [Cyanobium sp. FGCU-52]|nr:hypothetical protein [Cyanobium sp. FGCU52]
MWNARTVLASGAMALCLIGAGAPGRADTVNASCSVYPAGSDTATSSGPCTFSQRQGIVGITLPNGRRYDLIPVGSGPNTYRDQQGQPVQRDVSALGERGQIYRLRKESIFVYWDPNLFQHGKGHGGGGSKAAAAPPAVGTTVARLSDLIGARAGQAENEILRRGYTFVSAAPSGDAAYSRWQKATTGNCVMIRTADGRYQSIVYTGSAGNCKE